NAHVLDLFSGSGALAWEALSRGAASVVLVESQVEICIQLKQIARDFKVEDKAHIIQADIHQWLQLPEIPLENKIFDLVFLDPPFQKGLVIPILSWLHKWTSQPALVYVESELSWEQLQPELTAWECLKSTRAGESWGVLLRLKLQ
ncbi:MAG: RsmD family RNA methyltransferase, partial [Pseudomonadota bacterium]